MVGTLLWVVNVVGGVGSREGAEGRWWAVSRRSAGGGAVVRERCGWGAVRAVGAVGAVRAVGVGGAGGRAGAAIKHYFLLF